jgi:hypothetical protein
MPNVLTLISCHCGEKKLRITQLSSLHFEVRCTRCTDFAWGNTADLAVERWNKVQSGTENPNESANQPNTVQECCKLLGNLVKVIDMSRPDANVRECKVCGCKHIRLKADPGNFLSKGV